MAIFKLKTRPAAVDAESVEGMTAHIVELREQRSALWERYLATDKAAPDEAATVRTLARDVARHLGLTEPDLGSSKAELRAAIDDVDRQLEALRGKLAAAKSDAARAEAMSPAYRARWNANRRDIAQHIAAIQKLAAEAETLERTARVAGLIGSMHGPVATGFPALRLIGRDAKLFTETLIRAGVVNPKELS